MPIVQQRDKKLIFLIITLTLVYSISFVFSDWAVEQQDMSINPLSVYNDNLNTDDVKNWNYTDNSQITGKASETDSIIDVLYGVGSKIAFTQFLTLGYIGIGLTIFFNIFSIILWAMLIMIALSYIHDWIPLLSS